MWAAREVACETRVNLFRYQDLKALLRVLRNIESEARSEEGEKET